MNPDSFEKLGLFYLGKRWDHESRSILDEQILYDAKDLTTHAVCVGMTGSGKTGLCIGLLEEALIDGVPVIAIDPKGDIANLMLTFPGMTPDEFKPWIDPAEAEARGKDLESHAADTAGVWKKGIADWGQGPERVQRLSDSADFCIYTPGSSAGRPLSVLKSFEPPSSEVLNDSDLLGERISTAVTSLLALVGIDADPVQSREYILLANILEHYWQRHAAVDLKTMIQAIQKPPFDTIGILDLETVFPGKERLGFAMALNNLFASPSFSAWLEGDALDIQRLLWTPDGKLRCSIISIAHLNEKERMFVVSLLLNEMVAWMRKQTGTGSLRAVLYMDEVFGFFPPVAEPPSKKPMLTLLKQARAYGLGVVLATQNPVDLDYKGLGNTGTWFIGRLQTERDKERVLDGLESANTSSGRSFERKELNSLLSSIGKRVFLMNNVHEDTHILFHTRWVLSYLRGPLTRDHIRQLMSGKKEVRNDRLEEPAESPELQMVEPATPSSLAVKYLFDAKAEFSQTIPFYPAFAAALRLHYADKRRDLDHWRDITLLSPVSGENVSLAWESARELNTEEAFFKNEAPQGATFAELPLERPDSKIASALEKSLKEYAYRQLSLELKRCNDLDIVSKPGERPGDFEIRLRQALAEKRDAAIEKLRDKYEAKSKSLAGKIHTAEERVAREKSQYDQQKLQTVISFGNTLLGSLFGRRRSMTTPARGVGRAMRDRDDFKRSQENLKRLLDQARELEEELRKEMEALQQELDFSKLTVDTTSITPRKGDMQIADLSLVWIQKGFRL